MISVKAILDASLWSPNGSVFLKSRFEVRLHEYCSIGIKQFWTFISCIITAKSVQSPFHYSQVGIRGVFPCSSHSTDNVWMQLKPFMWHLHWHHRKFTRQVQIIPRNHASFNPCLFPTPPLYLQVKVYPLAQCEHGADDVLVLGTDGLWDVLSNQEVAEAVTCFLANCDPDDQHRHVRSSHSRSRQSGLNFLSTLSYL